MNDQYTNGPAVIVDPYSSGNFYAPAFRDAGVSVIAVQSSMAPAEVYAASYRPEDYACGVLDAVGMRFGLAHIEIMYTPSGPKLIELGIRPHGGGHPRFCRIATGESQVDRIVQCFTNNYVLPDSFQLKKEMLVAFLICRQAGRVANAEVLDGCKELESHYFSIINIHNDDWLEPTKDLFGNFALGFVVLANEEYSELIADYQKIREIEQELVISPS